MLIVVLIVLCVSVRSEAQVPAASTTTSDPKHSELLLIDRIEKLERRIAELEAQLKTNAALRTPQ